MSRRVPRDAFIITCEHGGNRVPAACRPYFARYRARLATHRGYDAGALVMARALADALSAPLVASTVSRLVVDLNRSLHHSRVFFEATRDAPASLRTIIVEKYYAPYRTEVERLVARSIARGRRVIHISSHSFTPVLEGTVRTADVGLLYDPLRPGEAALCARWKASLAARAPALNVRRNYPYEGKGDGLTRHLRARFSAQRYVGVELEVNQAIVMRDGGWIGVRRALVDSLREACAV